VTNVLKDQHIRLSIIFYWFFFGLQIRVIRKARRLGGGNGQFRIIGHQTPNWEWKSYKRKWLGTELVFPPVLVVNWDSFCVSFFLSACTAPTCTTSIITLEPCALNAEFQHCIPRFNKISLLCGNLKEGIGGESRGYRGWNKGWLYCVCRWRTQSPCGESKKWNYIYIYIYETWSGHDLSLDFGQMVPSGIT
jgi:hypothetical protein